MKNLVFIGSHLGYPMEKTPLGGGAMVGLQLVRHWPKDGSFKLAVLGSGPEPPDKGIDYVQLPKAGPHPAPVKLSELEYARFSRDFEAGTTEWLLAQRERLPPARTCVMVNDIAEGPDLEKLSCAGYPIVSVWHVDVVDYFNKLYLRNIVRPERLTRVYERSRRLGMRWVIPDMLQVVFEKQRNTVHYSDRMIMPSSTMAATVGRCYGYLLKSGEDWNVRMSVIPWGMWRQDVPDEASQAQAESLRKHFQIGPETAVLMTLSRISPEKGLHLLLLALKAVESDERFAGKDICLFLCGEPAFMQGAAYMRTVEACAAGLKRVRVFFPGYLAAPDKAAYFRLADVFISPSVHESYGLNVVEAMQAGVAILASDHYGVRDIVDPSFGRVVHYPSRTKAPERLAAALIELLSDPERLKEMGRAASAAAERMPFSDTARKVLACGLGLLEGG
ncbi:MAG: glycosyltransferase family 4 protein [Elusimicrobia bacterium]|nr:glycosyltransferase family 4 protein [Elusimicrobiota bacterium]